MCGDTRRELVHHGLRDRVFFCAPGEWDLYRCHRCGTGYLDPRPTVETVGLAYSKYFTHGSAADVALPPKSAWRRHRVAQRNAYLNAAYGYQLTPASKRVSRLSAERRQRYDKRVGYLQYPGKGARLLDVGCGNGRFLLQMRAVGWEVSGVEPDPNSAAQAVAAGLDVRSGLLRPGLVPERHFDAVTLNHVIEHLHQPVDTLRRCFEVMKPGGTLSVSTPNFASEGHRLFRGDWMPLDPPRHLLLFTPAALRRAMETAGFKPEQAIRLSLTAKGGFRRSMLIQRGSDPMREKPRLPLFARLKAASLARRAHKDTHANPELAEEIVLLARKPG